MQLWCRAACVLASGEAPSNIASWNQENRERLEAKAAQQRESIDQRKAEAEEVWLSRTQCRKGGDGRGSREK